MARSVGYLFSSIWFFLLIASSTYSTSFADFKKLKSERAFSVSEKNDTLPPPEGFSFFVSNRGSDSNDGRSPVTPRLNISSIERLMTDPQSLAEASSLNLEENSVFREEYDPVKSNGSVRSFGLSKLERLAKISGMDVINEWNKTVGTNEVYEHLLRHSIETGSPEYTYIIIAEIDTILEKTHPVAAVRYLTLVPNISACSKFPGSYFAPAGITNPMMIYIHPTEGSPGRNKYRYEVTGRNFNINAYNKDEMKYEHLYLQTSAQGYGMLSAGKNTLLKHTILQGGGTHHTVIKSGQIDSCFFLPGPKGLKDRIAAVFYSAEGKGGNNKITNTIFLDIPNGVYTHTDGSSNHNSLLLDKVYAFADTTDAVTALSSNDTDSVEVNNCYVDGYAYGWYYGGGTKLTIKNSIFRNINQTGIMPISKAGVMGEVKINNVLVETNGNDRNQNADNGWTAYGIRAPYNNVNLEVSNTILHCFSTWHASSQTVTAFQVAGFLNAHHNIYICDVNDDNAVHIYPANNSGGLGTSSNVKSNYNAYIILRGSKFHWIVAPNNPNNNNESNIFEFSEWQALTGQDKNSILIDLRNNPLGLKAIFSDPSNGNWTLTQSPEANAIRSISAGMTNPPLYYPIKPSVENTGTPFKTPAGISSFSGAIQSESQSMVQWQSYNESGFSVYNVEYSLDAINYHPAGTIKPVDDNSNHGYQFTHNHPDTDSIFYRLTCLNSDSARVFSSVIKLKGSFSQELKIIVYPNPFKQAFTVAHPRRDLGEIGIYDYSGRLIKVQAVQPRASKTQVSISNLPGGLYFVKWSSNRETMSSTIMK